MSRVTLSHWLMVITSSHGPKHQRDRHLVHALALFMRGDGSAGCYPSQRALATVSAMNRRTIAASLNRLLSEGHLEAEERRAQFGRKAYRYFPAVPASLIGVPITTPIRKGIGAPRLHQSANGADSDEFNGAVAPGIGAVAPQDWRTLGAPESHTEISMKGAASPSPATAVSAAPTSPRVRAHVLRGIHLSDAAIAQKLGVTEEQVRELLQEAR